LKASHLGWWVAMTDWLNWLDMLIIIVSIVILVVFWSSGGSFSVYGRVITAGISSPHPLVTRAPSSDCH
jgi:uncharacterized protein involved in cysteine biosynthesis